MSENELTSDATPEQEATTEPTPEPQSEVAPEKPDTRDELIAALMAEKDNLVYQLADLQNVIRRLKAQADQDRKFGAEKLVLSLLPVLDGFERTLGAAAKGASVESLTDGVRVIDKQLKKTLETVGVERVISLGAPFDPVHHEALDTVDDAELDEDTVVDELEAGYMMHGKLIRAAKVRVSRKP